MRFFGKQPFARFKRDSKANQRPVTLASHNVSRIHQLHELSKRFLSAPDLDSIVSALFECVSSVSAVAAITFRLRNRTTGEFDPVACYKLDQSEWRSAVPEGGTGLSKKVIDAKEAVTLINIQSYAATPNAPFLKKYGLVSYLGVPLIAGAQVIGVIGFYSRNTRGFEAADAELLILLADLAAVAVRYAQWLAEEIENKAASDTARSLSESSDRAKEEFLSVMSHEFRTPLTLIMGHAGMMREGLLGQVNDEQRNSLDRIMDNSDSLLAMVMSILQVSRLEAGGIQLVARDIRLHDLLDELKAAYGAQENEQRRIDWYCSPDLQALKSDPERLKDILRHLVDNAIKFTPRGRIVISAEKLQTPASIRFTVADTGIGVPPEALSFIFEKFRQIDSSGTRAFEGTGLGLYIAKKYAELLGGELSVTSELGKGSTFTLYMPLNS
jgi:signal transduction histidine kinase